MEHEQLPNYSPAQSMNKLINFASVKSYELAVKFFIVFYFFLNAIGVVKCVLIAGNFLYNHYFLSFAIDKLGDPAQNLQTLRTLVQYLFGVFSLFIYFLIMQFILSQKNIYNLFFKYKILICLNILSCAVLYSVRSKIEIHYWVLFWALTFTLPLVIIFWNEVFWSKKRTFIIPRWIKYILLGLIFGQAFYIFAPMILKPMLLENDYADISGMTKLKSGKWVDNLNFIKSHNIAGGNLKYDPRLNQENMEFSRFNNGIHLIDSTPFQAWILSNENDVQFRYTLYPLKNELFLNGLMLPSEYDLLKQLSTNDQDKKSIDKLYQSSITLNKYYTQRIYNDDELDFINKNALELINQSGGSLFYHHSYFFGPIFSIANGANPNTQGMSYGWLTTLFFVKLLPHMGGINYQTYFKVLFSFYPLYFLLFISLVLMVFRKIEYAILAGIFSLIALFKLDIQLIQLAPGFNPIRHFFDVFVLAAFFFYTRNNKIQWLILSLIFAIIGVLFSKDFGFFILLAVISTVLLTELSHKRYFSLPIGIALVFFAIAGVIYLFFIPGSNTQFVYMILGVASPPPSSTLARELLLIILGLYLLSFILWKKEDNHFPFLWAVFFYCQFLLLYYIFYPLPHHILSIASPFILLMLCYIYFFIRKFNLERYEQSIFLSLIITSIFLYIPNAVVFYKESSKYAENFKSHYLYHWNFPTAKLISTMDPQLFYQAVSLIQKYEINSNIYIISKYDHILPTLAGKYSAMLYPELLTTLVTQNDIDQAIAVVKKNKPKYIFIDTGIESSGNRDIYNPDDPISIKYGFSVLSQGRIKVLGRLKAVYDGIKNEYIPIERNNLITVYKLNQTV